MTATAPPRRGPSPRPRRRLSTDETPEQARQRIARHIAADPVLAGWLRDREAKVLEQAAARLSLIDAGELLRLAQAHRKGVPA